MAQNQKYNVSYFPHPTQNGKKMSFLRRKFGNDGYAVWYILLEMIGKADHHYLRLDKKINKILISSELGVEEKKMINIIEDLILLEEFDAELWTKYQVIYSEKFVLSIEDAYKKRKNRIPTKSKIIAIIDANRSGIPQKSTKPQRNTPEINQTAADWGERERERERESKEKEEKKKKEKIVLFSSNQNLINHKSEKEKKIAQKKEKENNDDDSYFDSQLKDKVPFLGKVKIFLQEKFQYVFDEPDIQNPSIYKIKNKLKRKMMIIDPGRASPTDEELYNAFKFVIENMSEWTKKNAFDLNYIEKNFERIYNQAKFNKKNENTIIDEDTAKRVIQKRAERRAAQENENY